MVLAKVAILPVVARKVKKLAANCPYILKVPLCVKV
jgi:hypothetical protein